MKLLLASVIVVVGLAAPALAAERLSDADIKRPAESIDKGFDAWQAQAVTVLNFATALGQRGSTLSLSTTGQSVWHSVDPHCEAIARAFGLPWPQTAAH